MRWLGKLRKRFLRGDRFERGLADEVAFHLESRAAALRASGLSEAEALRRARIEFGAVDVCKDDCRATRSFHPLDELNADVRYGLRSLRKSPAFTLAAVLSLAAGIGLNTGIFSLIDGLWLHPMAVRDGSSIVRLFTSEPGDSYGLFSWPEYREVSSQAQSFDGVVAIGGRGVRVAKADGGFELLTLNVVSESFFRVLGVRAAAGCVFGPEDAQALTERPVVVLGNSFWRKRYGADPAVVGRQIRLERASGGGVFTVLGVLPADFEGIDPNSSRDLWVPPQTFTALGRGRDFDVRGFRWSRVLGRLRSGVAAPSAAAETAAIAARLGAVWPETNRARGIRVVSDLSFRLERAGTAALGLFGIVALVVAMSVVNVANLLVARSAARAREFSIRIAIGAGRSRVVRQMLTESALIGVLGLAAGLALGYGVIRYLPYALTTPPGYGGVNHFSLDGRVLAFSALVTVLTTLVIGIVPALRVASADPGGWLHQRDGSSGRGRLDARHWLIATQLAMSLVLVSLCAVAAASFLRTRTADLGLARRDLLVAWSGDSSIPSARAAAGRLRSLPGVDAVTVAIRAPLSVDETGTADPVRFPGRQEDGRSAPLEIKFNAVDTNFFRVMGTPVLRGREFSDADQAGGPLVLLISETFAARYYAGRDPIGETISIGAAPGAPYRIVGVVRDVPFNSIGQVPEPYMYLPYWRRNYGEATFLVHAPGVAAGMGESVRRTLLAVDRRLDPFTISTQSELIRYSALDYELTAELVSVLSAVGLVLTAVGLYGVVAWTVTRRTREIGVRMAIGASRSGAVMLVLRQTAAFGVVGCAAGIPLAWLAARFAASKLYGAGAWDLPMLVAAMVLFGGVVTIASVLPALRAAAINPVRALRTE
jgi:macrolide transport system ATP-binding/permease protein